MAQRQLDITKDFSNDSILAMLVDELVGWLRNAEAAEEALRTLAGDPTDQSSRQTFDETIQSFLPVSLDWIRSTLADKALSNETVEHMSQTRKWFQQVDFLMMPDPKVAPEMAMRSVGSKLEIQLNRVATDLTALATEIQKLGS